MALPAKTGVTTETKGITILVRLAQEAGAKKVWVEESALREIDAG